MEIRSVEPELIAAEPPPQESIGPEYIIEALQSQESVAPEVAM